MIAFYCVKFTVRRKERGDKYVCIIKKAAGIFTKVTPELKEEA